MIIINIIIFIIIIILLFLTLQPMTIYDQLGTIIKSDNIINTNNYLANKQSQLRYIIFENRFSIYRNLGIVKFDSLTNTINFNMHNTNITFDIDRDKDKFILSLLTFKSII